MVDAVNEVMKRSAAASTSSAVTRAAVSRGRAASVLMQPVYPTARRRTAAPVHAHADRVTRDTPCTLCGLRARS